MNVVSTAAGPPYPGEGPWDTSLVLRTVVDHRSYLVAVTQGRVVEGQVELGLLGIECMQQVVNHCQLDDPEGALHFVEVAQGPGLSRQMAEVFARVEDGGAIVFLCRSAAVCGATIGMLNVRTSHSPSVWRH